MLARAFKSSEAKKWPTQLWMMLAANSVKIWRVVAKNKGTDQ